MNQENNVGIWVGVGVAIVIAAVSLFLAVRSASVSPAAGAITGITNYDNLGLLSLKVGVGCNSSFGYSGCSGTKWAGIVGGQATIWSSATTIAASSSAQVVLQTSTAGALTSGLTGVTADSICQVFMASSTNSTFLGLAVGGVSASSTAGSIVVQLFNQTGATFTWSAAASSSSQWQYLCHDPA